MAFPFFTYANDDVCEICYDGGLLYECDTCNGCFHEDCHPIPLSTHDKKEGTPWYCHRCTRSVVRNIDTTRLTSYGHLSGCLGRDRPNVTRACCEGKTADGTPCAAQVSKLSCLWSVSHDTVPHGRCDNHRLLYCVEHGHDTHLSLCANRICDAKRLSLRQRSQITSTTIHTTLGLFSSYYDEQGNEFPTNHVSDERKAETRRAIRRLQAENDIACIEIDRQIEDNRIRTQLAARSLNIYERDDIISIDEESNSLDRAFIASGSDSDAVSIDELYSDDEAPTPQPSFAKRTVVIDITRDDEKYRPTQHVVKTTTFTYADGTPISPIRKRPREESVSHSDDYTRELKRRRINPKH